MGPQVRSERRYRWEFNVGERMAFPTSLASANPVGFPGRIPAASVALSGPRPEPSEPRFWGLRSPRATGVPGAWSRPSWVTCSHTQGLRERPGRCR
jgi:hypothetical protein